MPAVTPTENRSRCPSSPTPAARPARSSEVGNASASFEGAGFPVRRPFPGALDQTSTDPFLMLDQMGPIEYGPGRRRARPTIRTAGSRPSPICSTARWSTATLRRRRGDPRRRHAVDDCGRRPRALRDADREDAARRRAHARRAALGEPSASRQATPPRYQDLTGDKLTLVPQRRRHACSCASSRATRRAFTVRAARTRRSCSRTRRSQPGAHLAVEWPT